MFKSSCTAAVVVCLLLASGAFAKSSKYDRGSTDSTDTTGVQPGATPAPGGAKASATTVPAAGGDKKVDLTDLESRYWTAKDTEFNVVQNRLYTKAHRFSITPMVGVDLSSNYTSDYNLGVALNYYFSERQGVGIEGWKTSSTEAAFATSFEQQYQASYNFNFPQGFIGAQYNWIPIYAKLSLLEKKIIYFDMSINPGIGATFLSSKTFSTPVSPSNQISQTPITFTLDVSQQFFLSEHWALKLDVDNHFYSETTYYAGTGSGNTAGTTVSSKFNYSAIFMLGVTFFQ
jgi:outer membrane beta-barrel protein